MSSSPRTAVEGSSCVTGAAPRAGYINGNSSAAPPCHVGIFSRACSDCRRSLLISLRKREWRGGLFLDSTSELCYGGEGSGYESPLMHFSHGLLPSEFAIDCSLAISSQHDLVIPPFVWPVLLALLPYLGANEGTYIQGIGSPGYWPW